MSWLEERPSRPIASRTMLQGAPGPPVACLAETATPSRTHQCTSPRAQAFEGEEETEAA